MPLSVCAEMVQYKANLFVDFGKLFQIVLEENDLLFQSQAASCLLRVQLYVLSERKLKLVKNQSISDLKSGIENCCTLKNEIKVSASQINRCKSSWLTPLKCQRSYLIRIKN